VTPEQLQILQHALGVDEYGRGDQYRNHFCAGGADVLICRELVSLGYMEEWPKVEWIPYFMFSVMESGKAAMLAASQQPPKSSRGQKRYLEFLNWKDAGGGSFREFLAARKVQS
jgi:hypothetical protein